MLFSKLNRFIKRSNQKQSLRAKKIHGTFQVEHELNSAIVKTFKTFYVTKVSPIPGLVWTSCRNMLARMYGIFFVRPYELLTQVFLCICVRLVTQEISVLRGLKKCSSIRLRLARKLQKKLNMRLRERP